MEYIDFEEKELINRYNEYITEIEHNSKLSYKDFVDGYINFVIVDGKHLKLVKDRITEYCGICGQETEIDRNGGYCEHCNSWVKPCSLCDMDNVNCSNCKKFERGV